MCLLGLDTVVEPHTVAEHGGMVDVVAYGGICAEICLVIPRHGKMNFFLFVVPVQSESNIFLPV